MTRRTPRSTSRPQGSEAIGNAPSSTIERTCSRVPRRVHRHQERAIRIAPEVELVDAPAPRARRRCRRRRRPSRRGRRARPGRGPHSAPMHRLVDASAGSRAARLGQLERAGPARPTRRRSAAGRGAPAASAQAGSVQRPNAAVGRPRGRRGSGRSCRAPGGSCPCASSSAYATPIVPGRRVRAVERHGHGAAPRAVRARRLGPGGLAERAGRRARARRSRPAPSLPQPDCLDRPAAQRPSRRQRQGQQRQQRETPRIAASWPSGTYGRRLPVSAWLSGSSAAAAIARPSPSPIVMIRPASQRAIERTWPRRRRRRAGGARARGRAAARSSSAC